MSGAAWGAIGGGAFALWMFLWLRSRRVAIRRIAAVVNRLDERPEGVESRGGSLESALARLERTTDRTNTRLAEGRLEYERLHAAIDAFEEGVVVVNELGRVVTRNAAAEQFVDARHGDALAEEEVRRLLEDALRGMTGRREIHLHGPPRRALSVRAVPLADAGGAVGAAAFITDVSEQRRVEVLRRDFVANVSHELKTPVGALAALAETLAAEHDGDVMRRLATRVEREAVRLGRLVDDLLSLSLLEAQEAPLREAASAADLVATGVDRVRESAAGAGVAVETADTCETLVSCDARQVASALFNLLDNAVKYSEAGGRVDVGAYDDEEGVVFWVRDEGMGIPGPDLERVFERFYRVDKARSRAGGGTGLGLAIVRHVAQAHGGRAAVVSEEGEGSTFSLVLPRYGPSSAVLERAEQDTTA